MNFEERSFFKMVALLISIRFMMFARQKKFIIAILVVGINLVVNWIGMLKPVNPSYDL